MSILAAMIAVIFFANPFISIVDIFPDAIGCILIWYALRRAEFFSPTLEEARKLWLKMALIAAADAVVSYFLFSSTDSTMILLAVSVFRISEAFFMYLAATKTFDGIVYLGTKFDGEGIYMHGSPKAEKKREGKERAKLEKLDRILDREKEHYEHETAFASDEEHRHRATERYKHAVAKISSDASKVRTSRDIVTKLSSATLTFIIIRTATCVLPEFTVLSTGDINSPSRFDIARYRSLFVILGIVIALIAAVIWAVKMFRYIGSIKRDRNFCREVRREFERNTVGHETQLTYRRIAAALLSLAVGVILTFDFYIDYKNYVPDYIAAVFFLIFFAMLWNELKSAKLGLILSASYGVASVAKTLVIANYIERFDDFTRTFVSSEARVSHAVCSVVAAVADAVLIALMFYIFRSLNEIADRHTGVSLEEGELTTDSMYAREELEKENPKAFVLSIISAAASVLWMICVGINKKVVNENEFGEFVSYVPVFTPITLISAIISIVFILYTVKYISDVKDEMKERFRYI